MQQIDEGDVDGAISISSDDKEQKDSINEDEFMEALSAKMKNGSEKRNSGDKTTKDVMKNIGGYLRQMTKKS